MGSLEMQFSRYPNYFSRDRQLALAKRYLAPELADRWDLISRAMPRVTWFDLCAFLAKQIAPTLSAGSSRRLYTATHQKDTQSVTEYAIWLQQFAPQFNSPGDSPIRHLYDRILPCIKKHMASRNKGYDGFRDLAGFVEYLQSMGDAIPERRVSKFPEALPQEVGPAMAMILYFPKFVEGMEVFYDLPSGSILLALSTLGV